MGGELDPLREQIPGQFSRETIYSHGDIHLRYHMIPSNITMEDTLDVQYRFAEDTLKDIMIIAGNMLE